MLQPLCDLDGVLANWHDGANEIHGRPGYVSPVYDWWRTEWDMPDKEFWQPIRDCGLHFYQRYVEPYPWMDKVLDTLRGYGPIVIATADPKIPAIKASKEEWIQHYIGDVEVIYIRNKWRLAAPGTLLIDDCDENIEAFRAAGGHVCTFPQKWNHLRRIATDAATRLAWLEDNLFVAG